MHIRHTNGESTDAHSMSLEFKEKFQLDTRTWPVTMQTAFQVMSLREITEGVSLIGNEKGVP